MANKKISELQSRTPALSDLILVGDPSSGYSYKCTVTALATIIETDIADGFVTIGTTQTVSGAKTFSNNLTLTSVANTPTDPDKFLTLNASNVVTYRTGAEVLSDIGGASSSSISGTTNYVAKFTSSSAVGNSTIQDSGSLVTIGSNTTISLNAPELTLNQGTSSASLINFKENNVLINRITSSGATLSFTTNNSATPSIVLGSGGTTTFGTIPNATIDTDKFLVSDGGVLKYRTGSEVLSDIGAATASSISGTTNYIPKFTSSTAIGNSIMYESIAGIGVGLTSPSATFHVNGTGRFEGSLYASEVYLSSPNNIVGIIDSTNANGGFLQFSTSSTVIAEMGASQSVIGSGGNNLFALNAKGSRDLILATNATERVRIASTGSVTLSTIANATIDTDKFLVSDSGVIKYRTGAEVLSDIGGASSSSISGTTNYIPKFTSSSAIGNSLLTDDAVELKYTGGDGFTAQGTTAGFLSIYGTADNYLQFKDAGGASGAIQYNHTSDYMLFKVAGTERLRISSAGNVGIGTSSPASLLDVSGSSAELVRLSSTATNGSYLGFRNSGTLNGAIGTGANLIGSITNSDLGFWTTGSMVFQTNGSVRMRLDASGNLGLGVSPSAWGSGYTAIQSTAGTLASFSTTFLELMQNARWNGNYIYVNNGFATEYVQEGGQHRWYNAPSGTAGNAISFTQAMTLDASGRLGIGTTSPQSILHLESSSGNGTAIRMVSTSTNGRSYAIGSNFVTGSGEFAIYDYTAAATRLWVSSTGLIGIGTTSPTFKLDIQDATTAVTRILHTTSNNSLILQAGTGSAMKITGYNYATSTAVPIYISVDGANTILQNGGGNVGIGVTSPSEKLEVGGNIIANAGNGQGFKLNGGLAIYRLAGDDLGFYTASTERMRITSGGSVGIGTTSPVGDGTALNLYGTTASTLKLQTSSSGTTINDGSEIVMYDNDMIIKNREAGYINFHTSNTERMRITSGGEVYIANTVDQGAYNLQVGGTGVWGAGAYVNGSDSALKQNIQPLDNSLDLVKQMKPVTYTYKESYSKDSSVQTGFIAQDLQILLKDKNYLNGIVKDGTYLSVAYQNLIPLLVKAIQEQQIEIEKLKNK